MISFKQLYEGLVSGEIALDENGHDPFYGWGPERLLSSMRHKIDFWDNQSSLSKQGIVWSSSLVSDHYRESDKHVNDIEMDSPCSRCGKHLAWIYDHENAKLTCVVAELNTEIKNVHSWFYEYEEERCEAELNLPQSFQFEVKEEIIFANFFKDQMEKLDTEEKQRKYTCYSLNHDAGRKRVCEFHAKDNIGYQQLGNTSVEIYLSEDKSEIFGDRRILHLR